MTIHDDFNRAAQIIDLTLAILNHRLEDGQGRPVDHDQIHQWQLQIEDAIEGIGQSDRIKRLQKVLNLDKQETAILLLAALPYYNVTYRHSFSLLNGNSNEPFPTLNILTKLVTCHWLEQQQLLQRMINKSPLLYWRFLIAANKDNDLIGSAISVPADVVTFLIEANLPESDCNQCLFLLPRPTYDIVPHPHVHSVNCKPYHLLSLQGPQGIGRKSQALYLSGTTSLYCMNRKRFSLFDDPVNVVKDILRLLLLQNANLYCNDAHETLFQTAGLNDILVQWLKLKAGKLFFAETKTCQWPGAFNQFDPCILELNGFPHSSIDLLWQSHIREHLSSCCFSGINWPDITRRFKLTPRQIQQICVRLSQLYPCDHSFTDNDILGTCRICMQGDLDGLATCHFPSHHLKQMVLSSSTKDQLEEIVTYTQHSQTLVDLNMRDTTGIQVLFWGAPGTGKTMAANVISAQLNRPLYKADLSAISSKWIGETEKHLAKLFHQAEQNNGVLFFDEADAVFAKRSNIESSHDKHSNRSMSYLLQRIEAFTGTLILATNFKGNLDPALLRRLTQSVEFPQPGKNERRALWELFWSNELPMAEGLDLDGLAELFEISGANIKNIVLHATVQALDEHATYVTAEHIASGIRREYQKLDNLYFAQQLIKQWLPGAA